MNLGMTEVIFIFLLALILFGPKKLPEIGREIGRFIAEFKRASSDFKDQLQNEIEKAGVDAGRISQLGAQQASSYAQSLLPAAVISEISEIDSAHERLMETAEVAKAEQHSSPEVLITACQPPELPWISAQYAGDSIPTPEAIADSTSETSQVAATTSQSTPILTPAQSNPEEQNSNRMSSKRS